MAFKRSAVRSRLSTAKVLKLQNSRTFSCFLSNDVVKIDFGVLCHFPSGPLEFQQNNKYPRGGVFCARISMKSSQKAIFWQVFLNFTFQLSQNAAVENASIICYNLYSTLSVIIGGNRYEIPSLPTTFLISCFSFILAFIWFRNSISVN